jgi:hypothetical protein
LPLGSFVEETEALRRVQTWLLESGRDDADHLSCGLPGDLVSRMDPITVCHRFGNRDLELARDL